MAEVKPQVRKRPTGEKEVTLRFTIHGNMLRCDDAGEISCNNLADDDMALTFGETLAGYLQGYFYDYKN